MSRFLFPASCALLVSLSWAQDSISLASKSISNLLALQEEGLGRVFAFSEDGSSYSTLDLFVDPPVVRTRDWPLDGGPQSGAAWGQSLLLHSNFWVSDSQRVARVAAMRYEGTVRGADSLIFRDPVDTAAGLADGATLSSMAIRKGAGDTSVVLGFGRLGVTFATLASQAAVPRPLASDTAKFLAFPWDVDTAMEVLACAWNTLCRADTVTVPTAGLDSVISVALSASDPDSVWILVGTQRGLRRGLWGSDSFPYVTLPGVDTAGGAGLAIRAISTSPDQGLVWAFSANRYFYSDDHGATFRDSLERGPGVDTEPASLRGFLSPPHPAPQAAFLGDTSYVNLNLDRPGLLVFDRDTILANSGSSANGGDVRLDFEDGLDIRREEGALTGVALARRGSGEIVLVVSSNVKGVFYRRLDQADTTFENINRLRVLRGALEEVITYPTLYTGTNAGGAPEFVRIGYRLRRDGRVTITVYNPAMERVRVIVRNAPRRGGVARSENVGEDRWDGRDDSGRRVSVGTYYILVESDRGEKAFGKVIVTRGRR